MNWPHARTFPILTDLEDTSSGTGRPPPLLPFDVNEISLSLSLFPSVRKILTLDFETKRIIPVKNLIFYFFPFLSPLPYFCKSIFDKEPGFVLSRYRRYYDNSITTIIILIDQIGTCFFHASTPIKISISPSAFDSVLDSKGTTDSREKERERASLESLLPRELNLPRTAFYRQYFHATPWRPEINESLLPEDTVCVRRGQRRTRRLIFLPLPLPFQCSGLFECQI